MNDAVARGITAMSSTEHYAYDPYTTDYTYVFTVDHEVKVITGHKYGENEVEYRAVRTCDGAFTVRERVCSQLTSTGTVYVAGLAWCQ